MKRLRFGIKTALIVTTVSALWLSTIAGYRGWNDIQALIWAAITVTSGVAALNFTGRKRAFWVGFLGTIILSFFRRIFNRVYSAGRRREWREELAEYLTTDWLDANAESYVGVALYETLVLLSVLMAALLIGFLCVFVYDQTQKNLEHDST